MLENYQKWENKIVALLYPPYAALLEKDKIEEEWKGLIKRVLKIGEIPDRVKKAQWFARGLDIPYFLENVSVDFKNNPVFKHPLSGRDLPKTSPVPELDKLREQVQRAVDKIKEKFGSDSKKLYFALWRLLPKKLVKDDPIWELMPADPGVPCYSWWIYNFTVSAFTSALDEPAFLQFTIASPQEFIKDTRRTQDFWMSSYLYSYLNWIAIKYIVDRCGPDCIIFPNLYEQPIVDWWLYKEYKFDELKPDSEKLKLANITNLFTAVLPEREAEKLAREAVGEVHKEKEEIASHVEEHIKTAIDKEPKLREKIREVAGSIENKERAQAIKSWLDAKFKNNIGREPAWSQVWERQIEDWLKLELFWVVYPWPMGKDFKSVKDGYHKIIGREIIPDSSEQRFDVGDFKRAFEQSKNYGALYQMFTGLVDRSLTTRKNLRDFWQTEEEGHKCSLCGKREALHPEWMKKEGDHYLELRMFWDVLRKISDKHKDKHKLEGRIRRGERLCAVCLTKRLAWEAYFTKEFEIKEELPPHLLFPSTSSIAVAKFKEKILKALEDEKLWEALKDYINQMGSEKRYGILHPQGEAYNIAYPTAPIPKLEALRKKVEGKGFDRDILNDFLRLDGEWFYPESFDVERIRREYGVEMDERKLKEARKALERLLDEAGKLEIGVPNRYLAIVAMDIDKMGDWLKGKRAPFLRSILHAETMGKLENSEYRYILEKRRPVGAISHASFSNAVKNFGLYVIPQVVEKELCGKIVYAGGDDSLMFLPVEDLLSAMSALHQRFMGDGRTGFRDDKTVPGGVPERGDKVTIKAGVAVIHHTHPLSHAIEETRRAEEETKKIGRDAFVIHLLKRAGEPIVARARWEFGDFDTVENLNTVKELFERKKLSSRFVYDMHEQKGGLRLSSQGPTTEALALLLKRLLDRHTSKDLLTCQEKDYLFEKLPSWFDAVFNHIENLREEIEEERRLCGLAKLREDEYEILQEYKEKMWEEMCNLLMLVRFIVQES